jgi:hypothetical protein
MNHLIALVAWIAILVPSTRAEEIFASAPPGPAGLTVNDPLAIGSLGMGSAQLLGMRFDIQATTQISEAGAYLIGNGEPMFAAIVPLASGSAFPSGSPFDSSTLAVSLFTPGQTSNDYFASFDLILQPGWYGLIMGAGYFGSPSSAGALLVEDGSGSPPPMFGWGKLAGQQPTTWSSYGGDTDFRMIVESVPEPAALPMMILLGAVATILRQRWHKRVLNRAGAARCLPS